MARLRRNDTAEVISGKDRGKRGKVLSVRPATGRAVVEGLNLVKKHLRKSQENPQGAVISRESPLPLDRVLPVCPKCDRGVRVGFKRLADGSKSRVCRRCEEPF